MRRPRISIQKSLAAIAVLALSFAGLRYPTFGWARGLFTLSLGTLVLALLAALFQRKSKRAFWLGYLVGGTAYLLVLMVPWHTLLKEAWGDEGDDSGSLIITTPALDAFFLRCVGSHLKFADRPSPEYIDPLAFLLEYDAMLIETRRYNSRILGSTATFRQIGHSLITLLAGLAGGLYAGRCYARRDAS